MTDFFEIDFLDVETRKSGDAITMRYRLGAIDYVHVVDAGFLDTGQRVLDHIRQHYDNPSYVDHVVATHSDGDHVGGLRTVLESQRVGRLWMLRPWDYAHLLLPRFPRFTSIANLQRRLREIYSHIDALERIAIARQIPISAPLQGAWIGPFRVLAPSLTRYLNLVVDSERTPEGQTLERLQRTGLAALMAEAAQASRPTVRSGWGEEVFPAGGTSAENEISVVQFAQLAGRRILLTGDAGRDALTEAANFATATGLALPGIDFFQVPHHGSRRNVTTAVLDRWLGPRLAFPWPGAPRFFAVVSSALADPDHPRKAVVRAMHHRGAELALTEGGSVRWSSASAPFRPAWNARPAVPYPADQEA